MTPLPATRLTGSLCAYAKPSSEVVFFGFIIMCVFGEKRVAGGWWFCCGCGQNSGIFKDKPVILKSLVPTVFYSLLILL